MFVLRGLCFDCHNFYRLRHDYGYLRDDGMQRGPSMRRRVITACRMYVQRGLCVHINNYNRVCGQHGHVPDDRV